jgi:hypothetical protein
LHVGLSAAAAVGESADGIALGDDGIRLHAELAKVRERDRPAVRGLDRDGFAVAGDGARERHDAGRRRQDGRGRSAGDVDAAMLPGRIGVPGVEGERREDAPVSGPSPRVSGRGDREHRDEDEQPSTHEHTSLSGGTFVRPR